MGNQEMKVSLSRAVMIEFVMFYICILPLTGLRGVH